MKLTTLISLLLILGLVALAIVDIWFDVVSEIVFLKLTITAGLVMVLLLCVSLIRRNQSKWLFSVILACEPSYSTLTEPGLSFLLRVEEK